MSVVLKIEQDFILMFGEETSGKFLARWPTYFKPKVIEDCRNLLPNAYVEELLTALKPENNCGKFNKFYLSLFVINVGISYQIKDEILTMLPAFLQYWPYKSIDSVCYPALRQ